MIVALQFILSISILVILHEFGHFLPARIFGMRVEKFYLFFDPYFALFKYKPKNSETEWGIGWLPLGGYVKISGMVDESMDKEQLAQEPKPWEFRSKPAWQRLIVMLGGVTVNFILGFFLLGMCLWIYDSRLLPNENAIYGIYTSDSGKLIGLKDGDKVLKYGDKKIKYLDIGRGSITKALLLGESNNITILRNNESLTITVPKDSIAKLGTKPYNSYPLYASRFPFVVREVKKDSPADKAGFLENDSLVALNGKPLQFFNDYLTTFQNNKKDTFNIEVIRSGTPVFLAVSPDTTLGQIGLAPFSDQRYFNYDTVHYFFGHAMVKGFDDGISFLSDQIAFFGKLIKGDLSFKENVGGFISISNMFPSSWNWEAFWKMTAILSLILGFMNLLPIPALDGGHVVFLLAEMVMRRPVNQKVLEVSQMVGFFILMSLLLYVNGKEVYELIIGKL